jgi:hypothetical protein
MLPLRMMLSEVHPHYSITYQCFVPFTDSKIPWCLDHILATVALLHSGCDKHPLRFCMAVYSRHVSYMDTWEH